MTSILTELEGKAPQICLDELYAAIYIASRQFIINGFPLRTAIDVMSTKHLLLLRALENDLWDYTYDPG